MQRYLVNPIAIFFSLMAIFLSGCSDSETTKTLKDTVAPYIVASYPDSGATNVSRSGPYWIAFSKPMEKSMLHSCISSTPPIPSPNFSWNGDTLMITPSSLLSAGTSYTLTIEGSWEDLNGNPIGNDKIIRFTTTFQDDYTPPEVVSTNPANGARNVIGTAPIEIIWSEPMEKIQTEGAVNIDPEPSDWWIEWESLKMIIYHTAFSSNTTVTIRIGTGAQDLSSNHMTAPYSFSFTIIADYVSPRLSSANPANNATGVPVNISQIVLTFSEPMDPNSFNLEPQHIDARIMKAISSEPYWDTEHTTVTVPVHTLLPGCDYWVWFWNVTDASGNVIDPSPTRYEFTTAGSSTEYPVQNGYVWYYARSWSGSDIRTIENYSSSTGYFDEVMRDGHGITYEKTYFRNTGTTIYHRGRSEYDNYGNLELTMMWEDPIPYLKLPLENHLGESWNFSTSATLDPTHRFELEGSVSIEPTRVDIMSEAFEATFRACYVHHLNVEFTIYEDGNPVDSGTMHQITWLSPCVGPIQIVSQDGGGSDTLCIYNWSF